MPAKKKYKDEAIYLVTVSETVDLLGFSLSPRNEYRIKGKLVAKIPAKSLTGAQEV